MTKKNCETCRYWSQMCAQVIDGRMQALCLSAGGPHHSRFTDENATCPKWAENTLGAWDEPPDYGETVRAQYEAEERGGGDAAL